MEHRPYHRSQDQEWSTKRQREKETGWVREREETDLYVHQHEDILIALKRGIAKGLHWELMPHCPASGPTTANEWFFVSIMWQSCEYPCFTKSLLPGITYASDAAWSLVHFLNEVAGFVGARTDLCFLWKNSMAHSLWVQWTTVFGLMYPLALCWHVELLNFIIILPQPLIMLNLKYLCHFSLKSPLKSPALIPSTQSWLVQHPSPQLSPGGVCYPKLPCTEVQAFGPDGQSPVPSSNLGP